jgi:hypothetical protein
MASNLNFAIPWLGFMTAAGYWRLLGNHCWLAILASVEECRTWRASSLCFSMRFVNCHRTHDTGDPTGGATGAK